MPDLEFEKEYGRNYVDKQTQELIVQGFEFDGERFFLDSESRADHLGMKTLESTLVFPVVLPTMTGGYYSLTQVNLDGFISAGLLVYRGHKNSGRLLKQQVDAATNEEELHDINLYRD